MNLIEFVNDTALWKWLQARFTKGDIYLRVLPEEERKPYRDYATGDTLGVNMDQQVTHMVSAVLPGESKPAFLGVFHIRGLGTSDGYITGIAVRVAGLNGQHQMIGNHDLSVMEMLSLLHFAASAQCNLRARVAATPADVQRKHRDALQSLLHRSHAEAEALRLAIAAHAPEDAEALRNAERVENILYALYAQNSGAQPAPEQQALLHRCGFELNHTDETQARRTAVANLMRNSVATHYAGCPADSGGVCNCTWLTDGEVLRTWLDETTVFTQR